MTEQIYSQLRKCVDQYGTGFPATDSEVEIKILKKLFTEEEARMYMNLTSEVEPVQVIAERTNQAPGDVSDILTGMQDKGLVLGIGKKGGTIYYLPAGFIPGFFEHNTFDMDRELAELCEQYLKGGFKQKQIFLRTIPVNTAVSASHSIAFYDDIKEIIRSKDRIMVTKCACVNHQVVLGKECNQPHEVCFGFDDLADYSVERGTARYVTQEEALQILNQCEAAGLVPNPSKGENIMALCNCGQACGHLDQLKLFPRPADECDSNYFAKVDENLCTACETCVDRCHMEAIKIGPSDIAEIDLNQCIGCGVCISTCQDEALSLQLKP